MDKLEKYRLGKLQELSSKLNSTKHPTEFMNRDDYGRFEEDSKRGSMTAGLGAAGALGAGLYIRGRRKGSIEASAAERIVRDRASKTSEAIRGGVGAVKGRAADMYGAARRGVDDARYVGRNIADKALDASDRILGKGPVGARRGRFDRAELQRSREFLGKDKKDRVKRKRQEIGSLGRDAQPGVRRGLLASRSLKSNLAERGIVDKGRKLRSRMHLASPTAARRLMGQLRRRGI